MHSIRCASVLMFYRNEFGEHSGHTQLWKTLSNDKKVDYLVTLTLHWCGEPVYGHNLPKV